MRAFNLCIIKPNDNSFSETFIRDHIEQLPGNKKVLYGGAFPVYDDQGKYLIRSKVGLLIYLIQKRVFHKQDIAVRNHALINYLKKEKIDVVLAEYGMVGAMVTQACKSAGVPLVVHFHGADVHHRPTLEKYAGFYPAMFAYASGMIAVSYDMTDALARLGADKSKIVWNPCGVDTDKFKRIDIRHSPPNFLSIGRFVEKKSPTSVVRAFDIVTGECPDAKLTMVGQGPLFEETKSLINELGLNRKVTLTGVLDSGTIRKLIRQSRCFVQHSITAADGDKEGTPVTILEAGSSGLAIVSTAHTGIKEAVINGETGYLVAEHDIEGMARYMIQLAKDAKLASALGLKEAEHIRTNYNMKDRIDTLAKVLTGAIKRN